MAINRQRQMKNRNVSIISFIPFINYYLSRNKKRLLVSNQTLISFRGWMYELSSRHRLATRARSRERERQRVKEKKKDRRPSL